jgi:hypothetical protein
LTSSNVLTERAVERLRELGVDLDALRKCLEERCRQPREHTTPARPAVAAASPEAGLRIQELPKSTPVELPPARELPPPPPPPAFPRIVRMFTPPDELERQRGQNEG